MAEMNIWDKFDNAIDTKALGEDLKQFDANNKTFEEIPFGNYEVKIDKLELTTAKSSGNPMLTAWFKILEGEFKGKHIYLNQVMLVNKPFTIHKACEFLRSLQSNIEIDFNTADGHPFADFSNLVMDVMEAIDGNLEFALSYKEGTNGYREYEITEVFELE